MSGQDVLHGMMATRLSRRSFLGPTGKSESTVALTVPSAGGDRHGLCWEH